MPPIRAPGAAGREAARVARMAPSSPPHPAPGSQTRGRSRVPAAIPARRAGGAGGPVSRRDAAPTAWGLGDGA